MASDKNYLGLGLVFKVVDKGFDKSLKKIRKALGGVVGQFKDFDKDMKKRNKAGISLGGPVKASKLAKIRQKPTAGGGVPSSPGVDVGVPDARALRRARGPLDGMLNQFMKLKAFGDLHPFKELMVGTQDIGQGTKDFDLLRQKMAATFDPKIAQQFTNASLKNLQRFGVGADDAFTMAKAMNSFGVSAKDTAKVLPMMGEMVGVLGLKAENVAEMFGQASKQLRMQPEQMARIVKDVNAMGKAYGQIDFVQNLPEIVDSVTDSMFKLGKVDEEVVKKTIKGTSAIALQFNKFGLSAPKAVQAAMGFQKGVNEMERSIRRMAVGLDPLNDKIWEIMPEIARVTGASADEIFTEMQKGPEEFNKYLVGIGKNLTGGDLTRFSETLRDTFGESGDVLANMLIAPNKAAEEAIGTAEASLSKMDPGKVFDEQSAAMQNSFRFMEDLKKSNLEYLTIQKDFAMKAPFLKTLRAETSEIQRQAAEVVNWKNSVEGAILVYANALQKGGLATVAFMRGQDALGSALARSAQQARELEDVIGPMFKQLANAGAILSIIGNLPGAFSAIGKMAKYAWDRLSGIGKVGGKITGFFEGIVSKSAVMKKAIPGMLGGITKWGSKLLGPLGAVIGFFDSVKESVADFRKGDLKEGILTALFGKKGGGLGTTVSEIFKWSGVGAAIGSIIPIFGTAIGGALGAVFGFMMNKIRENMSGIIESIGYWSAKIWYSIKDNGLAAWDFLAGKVSFYWDTVKSAAGAAWDWVKQKASSIWDGAKSTFSWEGIKQGAKDAFNWIADFAKTIPEKIVDAFKRIPDMLAGAWSGLKSSVSNALSGITGGFSKGVALARAERMSKDVVPSNVVSLDEARAKRGRIVPEDPAVKTSRVISDGPSAKVGRIVAEDPTVKTSRVIPDTANKTGKSSVALNQPQAPSRATMGDAYEAEYSSEESSQKIVDELVRLREQLNEALARLSERPVNVSLQGDASKFFKAVADKGAEQRTRRGG